MFYLILIDTRTMDNFGSEDYIVIGCAREQNPLLSKMNLHACTCRCNAIISTSPRQDNIWQLITFTCQPNLLQLSKTSAKFGGGG